MSYDSSNMEIEKGYKTPFRRSGHNYVEKFSSQSINRQQVQRWKSIP